MRDRYWALKLKADLPDESYASLERLLYENIQVRRREDGQGDSQPGALAKVASGTRGISSDVHGVPSIVQKAEQLWPGSSEPYCSLLWLALAPKAWLLHPFRKQLSLVVDEVRSRILSRHLASPKDGTGAFTAAGVRRLGRLTHIDALALLLLHGSKGNGDYKCAFMADLYATAVFARLARTDQVFALIADDLRSLIDERHPGVLRLDDPKACSAFNARDTRAWKLVPF